MELFIIKINKTIIYNNFLLVNSIKSATLSIYNTFSCSLFFINLKETFGINLFLFEIFDCHTSLFWLGHKTSHYFIFFNDLFHPLANFIFIPIHIPASLQQTLPD